MDALERNRRAEQQQVLQQLGASGRLRRFTADQVAGLGTEGEVYAMPDASTVDLTDEPGNNVFIVGLSAPYGADQLLF